ncbi:hypothetical protein [Phaeovulum sp.]
MDYLPTISFDTLALTIIALAVVRGVLVRFWLPPETAPSKAEDNGTPAH